MNHRQSQNKSKSDLLRYAGLGTQIFVAIGIAVFVGLKADEWLKFSMPLLVWILPLVILSAMIYKLIKETSNRNRNNEAK